MIGKLLIKVVKMRWTPPMIIHNVHMSIFLEYYGNKTFRSVLNNINHKIISEGGMKLRYCDRRYPEILPLFNIA